MLQLRQTTSYILLYGSGPFGVGRLFSKVKIAFGEEILLDFDKKYSNVELTEIGNNMMQRIYEVV